MSDVKELDVKITTRREISGGGINGDFSITVHLNGDSSSGKSTSTKRICKYYKKNGRCRDGDKCHNIHDSPNSSEYKLGNSSTEFSNYPPKSKICKYFESASGCKLGEECPFQHYRSEVDAGSVSESFPDEQESVAISEMELDQEVENSKNNRSASDPNYKDKNQKVCKLFLTGRCKYGNRCRYPHFESNAKSSESQRERLNINSSGHNENDERKVNTSSINTVVICKYFNTSRGCRKGEHCSNKHEKEFPHHEQIENNSSKQTTSSRSEQDRIDTLKNDDQNEDAESKKDNIEFCKYINAKGGCRKGNQCPNKHEIVPHKQDEQTERFVSEQLGEASDKYFNDGDSTNVGESVANETHKQLSTTIFESDITSLESEGRNKMNKICRYYTSRKGCFKGENCPNQHSEKTLNKNPPLGNPEDSEQSNQLASDHSKEEKIVCRFFKSKKGCNKDKHCPNLHIDGTQNGHSDERDVTRTQNFEEVSNKQPHKGKKTMESETENPIQKTLPGNSEITNGKRSPGNIMCRYFQSHHGCRKGNQCRFMHKGNNSQKDLSERKAHQENADSSNGSSGNDSDTKTDKKICKFHLSSKGCFMGEKCPDIHEAEANGKQEPPSNENELRKRELIQLQKRFPGDKCSLGTTEPNTVYYINVEPSDPDWPFVVTKFGLEVDFPEDYPRQLFSVKLLDDEDKYPQNFTTFMNYGLKDWCIEREKNRKDTDLDFRPFLKWFDKNLEKLFHEAASQVKMQLEAQQVGITMIHHKDIIKKHDSKTITEEESGIGSSNSSNEAGESSQNIPENDDAEILRNNTSPLSENGSAGGNSDDSKKSDSKTAETNRENDQATTAEANELFSATGTNGKEEVNTEYIKKGVEVKFSKLSLSEKVGTMRVRTAVLTVECNRCKTRDDIRLNSRQTEKKECKKCHGNHQVTYYSELIHEYSPIAGYLHMDGCKVFDFIINDSMILLNCLECNKDNTLKGMVRTSKKDHWCQFCNVKMEIYLEAVTFKNLQPAEISHKNNDKVSGNNQESKAKKTPREPGIKEGQPLPENGACKHYKKSYRWLRFPCCGKAYPCDICHEEKEEGGHDMKFANKMICGFCSKEQPFFKDKPCVSCKENVTKTNSSHWEGGKGCRDRSKMARSDKQKTAGEGKTVSRKKQDQEKRKN